jgi:hypothetical protein
LLQFDIALHILNAIVLQFIINIGKIFLLS